ncbi:LacI family DNA-binding transcriptional regulator [Bifidobacterium sp. ESL0732]|uniref:LacI family DNA-binding transcriptional regulator n=1 Tax=Bifidobacterium sp. ESL0732 TaxID=2983222 RepID=UPI0023F9C3E6|nr:LacI family DNA-binding transcriptional regulator [Bifidobacterium sp. ESL0732]WEV64266.1 LacI family DNA-binding transcriptional regulator [Bifidobacterium sp. ESL0732]
MQQYKHRVSMADVAHAAGVSPATVSRVLNDSDTVSSKTKVAVLNAADALGYVRNLGAVSLASSQTMTIGLLVRDLDNYFYGAVASCVRNESAKAGFDLLIVSCADNIDSQMHAVRCLLGHNVGGIIVSSGRVAASVVEYSAKFVPTVALASGLDLQTVNSVRIDPKTESNLAKTVAGYGHRCVAVTASSSPLTSSLHARTANFLTQLVISGVRTYIMSLKSDTGEPLHKAVDEAMEDGATAIMASSDAIALSILEYLDELGIDCPNEISVTGFDGMGPYGSPLLGITTVKQPVAELAKAAVDMVSARIADETIQPGQMLVKGEFVPGRTLGPANNSKNK